MKLIFLARICVQLLTRHGDTDLRRRRAIAYAAERLPLRLLLVDWPLCGRSNAIKMMGPPPPSLRRMENPS